MMSSEPKGNTSKFSDAWSMVEGVVTSKKFLYLTFAWFIFQGFYIAISTAQGIAPDEVYHYQLIKLFSEQGTSPILDNQAGYYFLGEATRTPFTIYHYLLSFPFRIFGDSDYSIFLLRAINIFLGVASLYITLLISRQLGLSRLVSNISIFMLANTLMFVFIFSVINYDNLLVPLSLATVYLLLKIVQKPTIVSFALLLGMLSFGLLTKINFLPLAAISGIIILITFWTKKDWLPKLYADAKNNSTNHRFVATIIGIFLLALLSFTAYRYISNALDYGTFTPACDQVLTVEQCYENTIYKRGKILDNGNMQAISISTFEYVARWTSIMSERIFGILGHKSTAPTKLIASWYQVLLVLGLVAIVRKYRPGESKQIDLLFVVIAFYSLILIYDRYSGYHRRGIIDLAVQGRYIFPVMPILYLLANKYIYKIFSSSATKFSYTLITLGVFITASLPSYLIATNPSWYTAPTIKINTKINQTLNITDN